MIYDDTKLAILPLLDRERRLANSETVPLQQAMRHQAAADVLEELILELDKPIDREAVHLVDDLV